MWRACAGFDFPVGSIDLKAAGTPGMMDKLKTVLAKRDKLACHVEAQRSADLRRDNRGQVRLPCLVTRSHLFAFTAS